MTSFDRLASGAAALVFLAFAMHNLNALYIEPNLLGFEDPRVDYAKVEKLQPAMTSWPWRLSGLGHLVTGFAAVILGFATHARFVEVRMIAARLALGAALLAGAGFLLTGISSLLGAQALELLAEQNADQTRSLFLAGSVVRISFNGLAIVAMGWFALQLSWCGLQTGGLQRAFCYFGYLAASSGLLMAFAYIPVYLSVYCLWALWMAFAFARARPASPQRQAAAAG